MLKNVWSLPNDQVDVPESHILLESRATNGVEMFLDMLVRKSVSVSLPILSMYFIKTLTPDKTTAALACSSTKVALILCSFATYTAAVFLT